MGVNCWVNVTFTAKAAGVRVLVKGCCAQAWVLVFQVCVPPSQLCGAFSCRRKWLAPSKGQEAGSEPPASKPQGMEVSDGLVRSMSAPRPQSSQNSVSSASSSSSDGVAGTGAAAAVKITMQLERDMVPDSMLESVLETRRLFLRHQEFRDGEVMTSSDPELSPVDIVEDIADVLLEELLQQQAEGEWCVVLTCCMARKDTSVAHGGAKLSSNVLLLIPCRSSWCL